VHSGLFRGSLTFTALASTPDYGGPAFDHAAAGAHLVLLLESLTGPSGGGLGFWESEEGEEGNSLTFEITAGTDGATNGLQLSETPGAAEDDPYGHVHGRAFTLNKPGFYVVGLRLVDTPTNGPDGAALHASSELFRLNLQAGVSIAGINLEEAPASISFAALPGGIYQLEQSRSLGPDADWRPVGDPVAGDGFIKAVTVPIDSVSGFLRLRRE
jgi:hypothetical protein